MLKKPDLQINLLKKNSCVVFISLLDPIGRVMSVSKQFSNVFQGSAQGIINQSCNLLMPNSIAKRHDQVLQKFIEKS